MYCKSQVNGLVFVLEFCHGVLRGWARVTVNVRVSDWSTREMRD